MACLTSLAVHAQADDEATIEMARERFREGVRFFDAQRYDKARAAFLQAYALKQHPAVLLNLAQSELRSGYEADAAEHFQAYLREHDTATDEQRRAAEQGLQAAKQKVGELRLTTEKGAGVYMDGSEKGRAPLPGPLYVMPGEHTIEIRYDDHTTPRTFTVEAGQSVELTVMPEAPEPSTLGPVPPSPNDAEGFEFDSDVPPTGSDGGRQDFLEWPGTWIGGGLAVVAAGGGVGFALAARSNYDDANAIAAKIEEAAMKDFSSTRGICNDPGSLPLITTERRAQYATACARYAKNAEDGDDAKSAATGLFIGAGVVAAGTIGLYFMLAPEEHGSTTAAHDRVSAPRLVPLVSSEFVGASLSGHF